LPQFSDLMRQMRMHQEAVAFGSANQTGNRSLCRSASFCSTLGSFMM